MNLLALLGFTAAMAVPDPALTPGQIDLSGCAYNHSTERFNGNKAEYYRVAKEVFASYGVPWEKRHDYELDHYIPRCLGGRDVKPNLWPQPLREAMQKEADERRICADVCSGRMTMEEGIKFFLQNEWAK